MASLTKRNHIYYLRWREGKTPKLLSLRTTSYQVAQEKRRQFESARAQGADNPLPTRTPIPDVLEAYVQHIRAIKTPKSAQTDIYYLREAFGPCCEALTITRRHHPRNNPRNSPRNSPRNTPRNNSPVDDRPAPRDPPRRSTVDKRKTMPRLEATAFELITPAQIGALIDFLVRDRGLKPKTANHYRSIIRRLFNWAAESHGVRLPGNTNPATKVRPYKERAPEIRYLSLPQIDEQLDALRFKPTLQTMVAVLIYAGLRREELMWLTHDDVILSRRGGGHGLIRVQAKTVQLPDGPRSWQPKTRVNRAVPISAALRVHLDRYTAMAQPFTPDARSAGGWFFPSPEGMLWDPDNFSGRFLKQANRDAGLPWTCLDYRHTFGSQLAQKGVSLYKISTLMGNSPEICRRHYASLVPEAMCEEVEFNTPAGLRLATG